MDTIEWTIYCHTHIESGRRYVGLTGRTWQERWRGHVCGARHFQTYFANAIRKYGKHAFSHEVLEVCHTVDSANAAEKHWIAKYDTMNPEKGFNLKSGGAHVPHPVRNPWDRPEFREKMMARDISAFLASESRSKQQTSLRSSESKAKRSALTKAALARPETVKKRAAVYADPAFKASISSTLKSSLASPEARSRMSEASRESSARPGVRERRVSALRDAMASPDVRAKLSVTSRRAWADPAKMVGMTGRRLSDETKAKISAASTGRRHTPESVEKQRLLYLARSSVCRFCYFVIEGKRSCIRGRVCCLSCRSAQSLGFVSFLRPDGSFVLAA